MKKYFNVIIILVVILTIYSCIVFAISKSTNGSKKEPEHNINPSKEPENPKEEEKKENDIDVLLSPKSIISYSNGKWFENKTYDYNNILFDVYVNNESLGKNYLTYNGDWYIYDSYKKFKEYDGNVLAIKGNKSYTILNYTYSELVENDKTIISNLLQGKNIRFNYDDMNKAKVIYDFDRDGFRETLYMVSNAFTEDEASYNKSFSYVFLSETGGTNKIIYEVLKDVSSNYIICNPYLQNIINIDNKINLILGCTYFSDNGTEHHLYELQNQDFIQVLKTSINQ